MYILTNININMICKVKLHTSSIMVFTLLQSKLSIIHPPPLSLSHYKQ